MRWSRPSQGIVAEVEAAARRYFDGITPGYLLAEHVDSTIIRRFLRSAMSSKQGRAKGKSQKRTWLAKQPYAWEIPLVDRGSEATRTRARAYVGNDELAYWERLFIWSNGNWRYVLFGANGCELLVLGRNETGLYGSAVACDANELYGMLAGRTTQFMHDHNILLCAK